MIVTNITIKQLVEFRRLSDRSRKTFANRIQVPQTAASGDGGGDYWISCLSAIGNTFRVLNNQLITDKIGELDRKYQTAKHTNTKTMYKRNLEILQIYQNFNLAQWRPSVPLKFLTRPKITLMLKNVPLQILPQHVFGFDINGNQMVGGIWFVHWLDGFSVGDLGMYTEAMYKYLNLVYGSTHQVDPDFCLTVDVVDQNAVSYTQLLNGSVTSLLDNTLDELNKLI
ncbi:hypothetical protein [Mucilaginibacter segetis]|uniref:Uncharacterized protein n=1 Tax=Mucilaginibacter segetis TaxID=2793071 RepID=A0A934UM73_9SPHI|nr:hypothetical protein [Mucilaginibacter segetis]MBK0379343.1 hypothetical protein [Mucilaginibacter segetis]